MTKHTVTAFDTDLNDLLLMLAEMAGWVERSVETAVDALMSGSRDDAERVIADDERVDASDRQVESHAVLMIARRQPMGDDLRTIVSAMRVSQDLERVGDLAKKQRKLAHGVDSLSRLVLGQLKHSIEAFVEQDTQKAETVWRHDVEIDALYTSLFRELLTYMMEDPRNISPCTHLLFCAKNLERIGDHATNIAERAVYASTGKMIVGDRQKSDETAIAVPTVDTLPS